MSEEFIEEHKEEITQLALVSGQSFDDIIKAFNNVMEVLADAFNKIVEVIKALGEDLFDILNTEVCYDPPQKLPRPPRRVIFIM